MSFPGWERIVQECRHHGIKAWGLGQEFHALIEHQFFDQGPGSGGGHGILAQNGRVADEADQREMHDAAKPRFGGLEAFESMKGAVVMLVAADQQGEQDVYVNQTLLCRFVSQSERLYVLHFDFRWRVDLGALSGHAIRGSARSPR
jgi:hypothetical protein